jgi:hypothetical protein
VQGADVLGGGRTAVEIGITQGAIGAPPHDKRVCSWLTQEALREL